MYIQDYENADILLLFDLSNLAYRCFYGYPQQQYEGEYIQHIYGSVDSILRSLTDTFRFDAYTKASLFFVLDSSNNWRKKVYSEYKNNRDIDKFNPVPDVVKALKYFPNTTLLKTAIDEADDIISYMAYKYAKEKRIIIVSSDSDLWQLLYMKNVSVFDGRNRLYIGKEQLEKHYGLKYYHHIPFYKTLFGDTSDNIKPVIQRVPKKLFLDIFNSNPRLYTFNDMWEAIEKQKDTFTKQGKLLLDYKDDLAFRYRIVKLRKIHAKLKQYKTTTAKNALPTYLSTKLISIPAERFNCCF